MPHTTTDRGRMLAARRSGSRTPSGNFFYDRHDSSRCPSTEKHSFLPNVSSVNVSYLLLADNFSFDPFVEIIQIISKIIGDNYEYL